jgi:microcystin-dependent protein
VPVQTDIIVDTITGFAGSGGAHNNVQPTVVLNYVIVAEK